MKKKCLSWQTAEGCVPEIIGGILAVTLIGSCATIFWPVLQRWALVQEVLGQVARQM